MKAGPVDCVIVGYNEPPFQEYESAISVYGESSPAYRDLRFNFLNIDGAKLSCFDTLNLAGSQTDNPGRTDFKPGDMPNLAVAYLASFLTRRGHSVGSVNLFQHEKSKLARFIQKKPKCVAITTTVYTLNFPVSEIVRFVRSCDPSVPIVVGGPLIANYARAFDHKEFQTAVEDIGADIYVIESQGESTLARLVACLKDGGDLGDVENIAHIRAGKMMMTRLSREDNSLDQESIRWDVLSGLELGPTIQMRTARSCAFNCSFCNYPVRAGKLALANLDTVEAELDSIARVGQVRNVIFIDDTFNVPLKRFKEICRLMIRKRYNFRWFSYFRCSNADRETFDLMAESGCTGVFLGLESGSPQILQNMHKVATVDQYLEGVEMLSKNDIVTYGSFINGFPGETYSSRKDTLDFIRSAGLDYYRMQLWYCEPGSPIEAERSSYDLTGSGFVWQHATMTSDEAMDDIERTFQLIDDPVWLPGWSFDFWAIPYLLGKGLTLDQIQEFVTRFRNLLRLEFGEQDGDSKLAAQHSQLAEISEAIR